MLFVMKTLELQVYHFFGDFESIEQQMKRLKSSLAHNNILIQAGANSVENLKQVSQLAHTYPMMLCKDQHKH